MSPVEELGAALETGNRGKAMAAYGKVGMVCRSCHATTMVKVQQKYHWGDFSAIRVEDPLTDEEVGFTQLMRSLDANFPGISVDVEQGQVENAQQQFQGFNARFQGIKGTCFSCHDSKRKYYVDEGVQALIEKLGQAFSGPSIDPERGDSRKLQCLLRNIVKLASETPRPKAVELQILFS